MIILCLQYYGALNTATVPCYHLARWVQASCCCGTEGVVCVIALNLTCLALVGHRLESLFLATGVTEKHWFSFDMIRRTIKWTCIQKHLLVFSAKQPWGLSFTFFESHVYSTCVWFLAWLLSYNRPRQLAWKFWWKWLPVAILVWGQCSLYWLAQNSIECTVPHHSSSQCYPLKSLVLVYIVYSLQEDLSDGYQLCDGPGLSASCSFLVVIFLWG